MNELMAMFSSIAQVFLPVPCFLGCICFSVHQYSKGALNIILPLPATLLLTCSERDHYSDFRLSIKSVWNTLSCCCFVCMFIIGQYHSENKMSSKSEAAGEIFFESEKHHKVRPLKTDTLMVSTFDHVHDESKHYLSHWFAQKRYRFTVHIKSIVSKFCSEGRTFSFVKTLLQSLWYVTASGANVLFYCQMSG